MTSQINNVNLATLGNIELNSFNQLITNNKNLESLTQTELENINNELTQRQELQINQIREIEDKEKLLLTRARMLQISQDRNAYKKKIIYTLIAVIFGIFILTLVIYVLFVRKIGMIKK
jgi:Fe2+ transport system protein B